LIEAAQDAVPFIVPERTNGTQIFSGWIDTS